MRIAGTSLLRVYRPTRRLLARQNNNQGSQDDKPWLKKIDVTRDYRRFTKETEFGREHQDSIDSAKDALRRAREGFHEKLTDASDYATKLREEVREEAAKRAAAAKEEPAPAPGQTPTMRQAFNAAVVKMASWLGATESPSSSASDKTPNGTPNASGGPSKHGSRTPQPEPATASSWPWSSSSSSSSSSTSTGAAAARAFKNFKIRDLKRVPEMLKGMFLSPVVIQEIVERCQEAHARAIAKELGIDVKSIQYKAVAAGQSNRIVAAIEAPAATPAQLETLQRRVNAECPASQLAAAQGAMEGEVEYVQVGKKEEDTHHARVAAAPEPGRPYDKPK